MMPDVLVWTRALALVLETQKSMENHPRTGLPGTQALMTDAKPFSSTKLMLTTRRTLLSRGRAVSAGGLSGGDCSKLTAKRLARLQ
jgi:predicted secreted protein